jgi:SET domain-containing protein
VSEEQKDNGAARMVTPSLPGYLFVARTSDRGRGVFTSKAISKGEVIEVCPMIVFSKKDREQIDNTFLYEYYFEWGKHQRKGALALGFGSVYNHSYNPNARYEPDFDLNIMEYIAVRDIEAGEEITTNYNYDPTDKSPVWWEKQKIKKKKQHP